MIIKEMVGSRLVDEPLAQRQTQMVEQVKEVAAAYHTKVTLKREAIKQYDILNDQIQDKVIELVEKEIMLNQLQIAFEARETVESKS